MSQLKKFIEIVEDYPALRVVDDGDFEVDLSEEEMRYYNEIMCKYGELKNFLIKKIKDLGENPEDYDLF